MKYISTSRLLILILGAMLILIGSHTSKCRQAGGVPVGMYGTDCYDNNTKTFIKP